MKADCQILNKIDIHLRIQNVLKKAIKIAQRRHLKVLTQSLFNRIGTYALGLIGVALSENILTPLALEKIFPLDFQWQNKKLRKMISR